MSWASTLILSIAWLFGPLQDGQNEISISSEFAQSSSSAMEEDSQENRYSGRFELRSAIAKDTWMTLDAPYVWTRRSLGGKLHYDRSGLSTLTFRVGHQMKTNTHLALGISTGFIELGTPVSERFPTATDRFATLGPSDAALEWVAGHQDERDRWRWGLQATLRLPRALDHALGEGEIYALFRPGNGGMYLGPGCHVSQNVNGQRVVEFRAIERLQFDNGWALELTGFTQAWTVDADAQTGLTGGIRWRG